MLGPTKITFTGLPLQAKGIAKRELNNILRGAWFKVGQFWHRRFRPKHFTHRGATEYGYAPRQGERSAGMAAGAYDPTGELHHKGPRGDADLTSGGGYRGRWRSKDDPALPAGTAFTRSYTAQKLRAKGHTYPLVWSGRSKARSEIQDIRPTAKGVRIVINAPALNLRPGRHGRINLRDEMTEISAGEEHTLTELLGRLVNRGIRQNRTRSTVTVG